MEIRDKGKPVGATCELGRALANWSLTLNSRGGALGSANERNPGYLQALELILHRLAMEGATLVDVLLDSSEATKHLSVNERRLLDVVPLELKPVVDVVALRKEITRSAARTTIKGKVQKKGNPTKRIRLLFSFPVELESDEVVPRIVNGEPGDVVNDGSPRGRPMSESIPMSREIEIQAEQKYLDEAWEHRERERGQWGDAPKGGASKSDQSQIRNIANGRISKLSPPDEPAAFGRIDAFDAEFPVVYVGMHPIWDDKANLVVYGWQSPQASHYSKASMEEPVGLKRKRTFDFDELRLVDFFDINFDHDGLAEIDVAEPIGRSSQVDDFLLAELDRARSGEMREIARTIQARQFELISAKINQVLIVQGGPGTGKTAVALHRLSWILFNFSEFKSKDVLVIGPNTTFLRYISAVLPALGDHDIPQRDIVSLGSEGILLRATDKTEVVRLKGSLGMTSVLKVALKEKIRLPISKIEVSIRARQLEISPDAIRRRVEQLSGYCFNDGRREFRRWLSEEIAQGLGTDVEEVRRESSKIADSIWPLLNSRTFVYELLSSREKLVDALLESGGVVQTEKDWRTALGPEFRRPPAGKPDEQVWSESDIPLLDFADQLINGKPSRQYDHIVVDEAQDLSPMQLLMINRRSVRGSITLVGDIAQSTGSFSRSTWDEVVHTLGDRFPVALESLKYGYRLPSEVHRFIGPLRRLVAPELEEVEPVRSTGVEPRLFQVGDERRSQAVFEECRELLLLGAKTIGIIGPDSIVASLLTDAEEVEFESHDLRSSEIREGVNIVPVSLCKGLEFDAVVVVAPETIATSEHDGLRRLYIALTRTTRYLSVFYALAPLPGYEGWPTESAGELGDALSEPGIENYRQVARRLQRVIDTAVAEVIDVLGALSPDLRPSVLTRAESELRGKE